MWLRGEPEDLCLGIAAVLVTIGHIKEAWTIMGKFRFRYRLRGPGLRGLEA